MSKIIGLANSCKDCPNRHYYSSGAYECALVQNSRLNADNSIPGWCPLADYPVPAPVADSAMAKDAERYRWLRDKANSMGHLKRAPMVLMTRDDCSNNGWEDALIGDGLDAAIDAALAASEPKKD